MTRVSVVIATYDGTRFLAEQLRSILAQDRPADEIVVADDGSTDGTLDLVRQVLAEGSAPDVVILPPGGRLGVAANVERALRAATGDVIALSDQDDVWHPDRVSAALDALAPGTLLQHADARIVGADGAPLGFRLFEALGVGADELSRIAAGEAFPLYLRRNLATGAATVVRRELLDLALPIPAGWIHDEWLTIVAAALGGVAVLDRPVIDYRQHGSNQIGVARPTLAHRLRRMLQPRDGRYRVLAARARVLEQRLGEIGVAEPVLAAARGKRVFEEARAQYPRRRVARLGRILRRYRAGDYARYSSQRDLDVVRDLVQPAGDEGLRPSVSDR